MKQNDLEIIRLMRTGKRLNISNIARQLNLPISTVSDRIRRIEKKYVLKRTSVLDYPRLGYFANARIAMKVNPEKKSEFLSFLRQEECVNSIYHINDGFDFLIDCVWKDAISRKNWICGLSARFPVEFHIFNIIKVEEKERFVPK
jgi:Lrp/AsnC family transcriptional regulator for asnA, asnC and gidA